MNLPPVFQPSNFVDSVSMKTFNKLDNISLVIKSVLIKSVLSFRAQVVDEGSITAIVVESNDPVKKELRYQMTCFPRKFE